MKGLARRWWGFWHPNQFYTVAEIQGFAHRIRFLLSQSNAGIVDAHLSRDRRAKLIKANDEVIRMMDSMVGR